MSFQHLHRPAEYREKVKWHTEKLASRKSDYERVGNRVKVPWYLVGIVHGLEASFRFGSHLNNGDPLTARVINVPKNRPPQWNPPNDWDASAVYALAFEGVVNRTHCSLPRMRYRWEDYNSFGSRAHGLNAPYLWRFSHHYTNGKYKADVKRDLSSRSNAGQR